MRNDIPTYPELRLSLLELLDKEGPLARKEIFAKIHKMLDLSEEVLALKYEKQNYFKVDYRISWSEVYLVKAGLLVRPRGAVFQITEEGRSLLKNLPESISNKFLVDHYPAFKEWRLRKRAKKENHSNCDR